MDSVLDLWLHTVYNDARVKGAEAGPVVYFRNNTGNPFVSYSVLFKRWNISKSSVGRLLTKLANCDYLTIIPSQGSKGSVIYLNNYLQTMFEISDTILDKDEIAISLNIKIPVLVKIEDNLPRRIRKAQIQVVAPESSVPLSYIRIIMEKVDQFLSLQGLSCCSCPSSIYKLFYIKDCKENSVYELSIECLNSVKSYHFELRLTNSMEAINETKFV